MENWKKANLFREPSFSNSVSRWHQKTKTNWAPLTLIFSPRITKPRDERLMQKFMLPNFNQYINRSMNDALYQMLTAPINSLRNIINLKYRHRKLRIPSLLYLAISGMQLYTINRWADISTRWSLAKKCSFLPVRIYQTNRFSADSKLGLKLRKLASSFLQSRYFFKF